MMADTIAQAVRYRAPELAYILFHETAEIGLVERRIASADRRWLCDGTANYVAWRVARDLVDAEFAKQCYDLDDQLHRHAVQQPHVALADWPAVEKQDPALRETALNRAHYAFATRAMFLLAEKHGDDALASIWREVRDAVSGVRARVRPPRPRSTSTSRSRCSRTWRPARMIGTWAGRPCHGQTSTLGERPHRIEQRIRQDAQCIGSIPAVRCIRVGRPRHTTRENTA